MMLGTRLGVSEGLDTQVQGTNDDAQVSKLSCSRAGYFRDDFIQYFVRKPVRRSPLINRGYYSRYAALRKLLLQFLDMNRHQARQKSQVLVLGAGYDTTWFQLADLGKTPTRYVELDFKQVTQKKVSITHQQPVLWNSVCTARDSRGSQAARQQPQPEAHTDSTVPMQQASAPALLTPTRQATQADSCAMTECPEHLQPSQPQPADASRAHQRTAQHVSTSQQPATPVGVHVDTHAGELISGAYCVLPVDLRNTAALQEALARAGIEPDVPTYILSECVLVYMEPDASSSLLRWLASYFSQAAVVIYEQIRPDGAFGRQMMSNLEARGCPLRGLPATPSLLDHCKRLQSCGWPVAKAWDMDSVYKWHLDAEDKQRVEGLEVFDEFEEWHLIQEHYSISIGLKGAGDEDGTGSVPLLQLGFGVQGCTAKC